MIMSKRFKTLQMLFQVHNALQLLNGNLQVKSVNVERNNIKETMKAIPNTNQTHLADHIKSQLHKKKC